MNQKKVLPFVALVSLLISSSAFAQIVIGHRGASGYRPEHTLASYELAIDLGADFIEPDLVSTRDGALVARHENAIAIVHPVTGAVTEATTDVMDRPEFASRKTTKIIDGVSVLGWFTEDFTLAELKTLRAKERLPQLRPQNTAYDGLFEVPTLQEVIDLAKRKSRQLGRTIGIYPETKHPSYFQSIGLALEEPLVTVLEANGYNKKKDAVYIQSFEVANLQKLSRMTKVSIAQLINNSGKPWDFVVSGDPRTYADMTTPDGLRAISKYADGIGANKNLIVPRDSANRLLPPTSLIADAHKAGLIVHAWTFRSENNFLPVGFRSGDPSAPDYLRQYGDYAAEYELFYSLGLDGVFSDQPDHAVMSRH